MQKEFSKTDADFKMFADFWKMYSKYYIPEPGNPNYWDDLIGACDEFTKKYLDNTFALRIAMSYMGYLNEKANNSKQVK